MYPESTEVFNAMTLGVSLVSSVTHETRGLFFCLCCCFALKPNKKMSCYESLSEFALKI